MQINHSSFLAGYARPGPHERHWSLPRGGGDRSACRMAGDLGPPPPRRGVSVPPRASHELAYSSCRANYSSNRCDTRWHSHPFNTFLSGIQQLVMERQCLGPPHAARAIVLSHLDQGARLEVRVFTALCRRGGHQTHASQDSESVVPSIHPMSLTFSSSEAERRFRIQHHRAASRFDTVLDTLFAALYFALLVPCLDAWGMDTNPTAPSTLPFRLTSLASSFFVLLGIGPLMLAAAQLDWVSTHRTILR